MNTLVKDVFVTHISSASAHLPFVAI